MDKGICTVSVAAIRAEQSHRSEMTSQLLYGESVDILEKAAKFIKVKMHFDGYEGWIEYRRTGFPVFDATSGNLNNSKISSRFVYPTDEQSINKKNYNAEIAIQGGTDDANYKAWWEK